MFYLKQIIRSIDLFNTNIHLSLKNDIRYRTFEGGIITIIFFFFSLATVLVTFPIIVKNRPFRIITHSKISNEPTILSSSPVLFSLYGEEEKELTIDKKLFYFEAKNIKRKYVKDENKWAIIEEEPVELLNCSYLYEIDPNILSSFRNHELSKYVCLNPKQNISIYGTIGDIYNTYSGLRLYIKKCNPNITTCYNSKEAEEKIRNKNVFFSFESPAIDYNNGQVKVVKQIYKNINPISYNETRKYYYQIYKQYFKIESDFYNKNYQSTVESFNVDSFNSEEIAQSDEDYGFIQVTFSGNTHTTIQVPESFLTYLGVMTSVINALYILLSSFMSLVYDKLFIIELMENFNDKLNKEKYQGKLVKRNNILSFRNCKKEKELKEIPFSPLNKFNKFIVNSLVFRNENNQRGIKVQGDSSKQFLNSSPLHIKEYKPFDIYKKLRKEIVAFVLCPLFIQRRFLEEHKFVINRYIDLLNIENYLFLFPFINFWKKNYESFIDKEEFFPKKKEGNIVFNSSNNLLV